jgi:hypothetical protein
MKLEIKMVLGLLLSLSIVLAGCAPAQLGVTEQITVYKSSYCGCCEGFIAALQEKGFTVETVNVDDMAPIKEKYNIPSAMESCHTTVIGDYVLEGHVPIEAIQKLLLEKPAIDGIALPRMPAGSLGMPGSKTGTWTVYAMHDGQTSVFMEI